jgi:glycosyltransferase involved in cell wall biosynthesis
MIDNTKITFIIPTIGRPTLQKTIECLLNQTCCEWKAIIIFDGISPTVSSSAYDNRIQIIQKPKTYKAVCYGGDVRNYGIQFATTEWVAFVDDDDGIKSTYVETFLNEIASYDNDLIIFRMIKTRTMEYNLSTVVSILESNANVSLPKYLRDYKGDDDPVVQLIVGYIYFPRDNTNNFYKSDVGISFAAKKHIFDTGIKFDTSDYEDFDFLDKVRESKYKMMISPFILYYVRMHECNVEYECNRVFINH